MKCHHVFARVRQPRHGRLATDTVMDAVAMKPFAQLALVLGLLAGAVHAKASEAPEKFPFRSRISDMWTVLYFQPAPDGKTSTA